MVRTRKQNVMAFGMIAFLFLTAFCREGPYRDAQEDLKRAQHLLSELGMPTQFLERVQEKGISDDAWAQLSEALLNYQSRLKAFDFLESLLFELSFQNEIIRKEGTSQIAEILDQLSSQTSDDSLFSLHLKVKIQDTLPLVEGVQGEAVLPQNPDEYLLYADRLSLEKKRVTELSSSSQAWKTLRSFRSKKALIEDWAETFYDGATHSLILEREGPAAETESLVLVGVKRSSEGSTLKSVVGIRLYDLKVVEIDLHSKETLSSIVRLKRAPKPHFEPGARPIFIFHPDRERLPLELEVESENAWP